MMSGAALADDAALRGCRGITDAAKRLACYDALPLSPALSGEPLKKEVSAPIPAVPPAATATPASPATPAPTVAAKPAPPTAAQQVTSFGLVAKAPKDQIQNIESTIPGHFDGWGPRSKILLANGQVWRIDDDTSVDMDYDNPKVVIRRGSLGVFFMDVANDNHAPRVMRVQ